MVANMAAFIATFTHLQKDASKHTTGHAINIGMLCLSLILTTVLIFYCKWENKKRASGARNHILREENEEMLGYKHPKLRYTI